MTRILLVDDHGIIREGLRHILERQSDMTVVGEAEDGIEALEIASKVKPDVVILDISMPRMDGFDCARALASLLPNVKILALTVHDDIQYALRIIEAGAHGFVSKRAVSRELIDAIHTILSGRTHISSRISANLASQSQSGNAGIDKLKFLSNREFQVLRHLGAGRNLSETAEAVGISEKTVSTYRNRLLNKLGFKTTAELLRYAIELDLSA